PDFDSKDAWQRVMIGHAVANQVGVVAANRTGTEGDGPGAITFYGSSFISDHRGEKLAEMDRSSDGVITATFDLERLQRARASMGFFRDRRPELYGPLAR